MKNAKGKKKAGPFDPRAKGSFKLSRTKLEDFLRCPRCFYLDRRLGISQPGMPAFTLNSAVDHLLKAEFDYYRLQQKPHPVMTKFGIEAVPLAHPLIDEWRQNFKGVQFFHKKTNLIVFGAVDDIWVDKNGVFFVVDYKSTSTTSKITLESEYRQAFKRQMEIYQWLLRQNNFPVSNTGYFLFCNADRSRDNFDARLEFQLQIISYEGKDSWVEDALVAAKDCLLSDTLPEAGTECAYCKYRQAAQEVETLKNSSQPLQSELFNFDEKAGR